MTADVRDWSDSDYVRVYQTVRSDTKFESVYADDRAFAAYVRLLMDADAMYPIHPHIPATLSRYARDLLVKAGVLVITGTTYTISGLAKERESRFGKGKGRPRYPSDDKDKQEPSRSDVGAPSESSRNGSDPHVRAHASDSDLGGSSSSTEGGSGETDEYGRVVQWLAARKAWIDSPKIETVLARLVDRKGAPAVLAAMAAVPGAEDAAQFVYGARNALLPLPGSSTVTISKEQREAQERAERRRALGLDVAR